MMQDTSRKLPALLAGQGTLSMDKNKKLDITKLNFKCIQLHRHTLTNYTEQTIGICPTVIH